MNIHTHGRHLRENPGDPTEIDRSTRQKRDIFLGTGAKRKRAVAWQPSSDDGADEDTVNQLLGAAPSRSASPSARSSSPVVADEYDEDMDQTIEWTKSASSSCEPVLTCWRRNSLYILRAVNVGKDVADLQQDVRHATQTGKIRQTTWAQKARDIHTGFGHVEVFPASINSLLKSRISSARNSVKIIVNSLPEMPDPGDET
ncbi:hypothetical protein B0H14DRAFT_2592093 [Mycena olivaceomarginata]|nr:hypothetical protein B0H14DRAFT_2592093 [Mycena olivaceomarginata]